MQRLIGSSASFHRMTNPEEEELAQRWRREQQVIESAEQPNQAMREVLAQSNNLVVGAGVKRRRILAPSATFGDDDVLELPSEEDRSVNIKPNDYAKRAGRRRR